MTLLGRHVFPERRLMADPLAESWTPKRQYPGYLAGLTTQQPAVIPPRLCEPLSIDHCRGLPYNLTSYPNAVGHNGPKEVYRDLVAYRQLVDSECYPLAAEFVCQLLQPECVDDEMLLPCRDFCEGRRTLKLTRTQPDTLSINNTTSFQ